jgi:hypothetical protein
MASRVQRGLALASIGAAFVCAGGARASVVAAPRLIEANAGQLDARVRFYGHVAGAMVYFTDRGPVIELRERVEVDPAAWPAEDRVRLRSREQREPEAVRTFALAVSFVEPSARMGLEPLEEAVAPPRHFVGAGGAGESRRIPAYDSVVYRDVMPGIDVVYAIEPQGLAYEIHAAPGRDASRVRFAYEGVEPVEHEPGSVDLATPLGTILDRRNPASRPGGRLEWTAARVEPAPLPPAFEPASVAAVDTEGPSWATFVGGSRDEAIYALAVDADANIVLAGTTRSTNFPTTLGAVDTTYGSSFDAFVAKLSADGSELLWSTYIGGTADDRAWALALDGSGRPVVAGVTSGSDFPTTAGAFDTTPNGLYDAFVLTLAADGSAIVWSTLYGGSDSEWDVSGVAVDGADRVVLAGSTRSPDLPLGPLALDSTLGGVQDAFVARFAAGGATLERATYLGGAAEDVAEDVTVGAAGGPVVVGRTRSTDLPVTAGALQPTADPASQNGFSSGFVPDLSALAFSTYLGGSGNDEPYAVALDGAGRAVIAGKTDSTDFPVVAGAYSPLLAGGEDAFLTKIAADASSIVFSTFFGGASTDRVLALVESASAGWLVSGWTCSEDLPLTQNAYASVYAGPCEAFVALIASEGSGLAYGTYLGGYADDMAFGVAADAAGRLIAAGGTRSPDFPVTTGAYQTTHASPSFYEDAFVASLSPAALCTLIEAGPAGPELSMSKAPDGRCPAMPDLAAGIDLVEGALESLSPSSIGTVSQLVCAGIKGVATTVQVPAQGQGLFQLARESQGGAYTDGAGSGLVGQRTPLAGDCP